MRNRKKWEMPPEALNLVAERFKILAEPLRLRILQALEEGERSVTEITATVESTQPNVSKHLKTLQDAGLLARRQEGNTVFYQVADETVFELCDVVCASLKAHLATQSAIFKN